MDKLTPLRRSDNMRAIRSKDMKPELAVRHLIHSMGYRYRLHRNDLPGKPDMVFSGRRKIIFVHGCFWHQHSDPSCKMAHYPRSNLGYWQTKLGRTQARDSANCEALQRAGWCVLIIWECETKDKNRLASRLYEFLEFPSETQ